MATNKKLGKGSLNRENSNFINEQTINNRSRKSWINSRRVTIAQGSFAHSNPAFNMNTVRESPVDESPA